MDRDNTTTSWLPNQRVRSTAIAALIGLFVSHCALGFQVLDPQNIGWIFYSGVDPSHHFIGWHMFRFDEWRFPVGAVNTFGHPIGTSIALTDSIPLVAIPLKTISAWLPTRFQYLGAWLITCYVLQSVFGALVVGTVTSRLSVVALGAALFALSPLVVHRMTQEALTAHWLTLAAIWLYFSRGQTSPGRLRVSWAVVVFLAAATHPYITGMVLAIAFAAAVRDAVEPRMIPASLIRVGVTTAALVTLTALVWWVSGYFVVGDPSDLRQAGFGDLSLNMAAPFVSTPGTLFYGRVPLTITLSQYEGYAYLGLGTAALLGIALPLLRFRPERGWLRTRGPLWLACIVLTLLALGPHITAGSMTVFEYDPRLWGPLSIFRANGRMFWPTYYTILFGAITLVIRRLSPRMGLAVLALAVGLQAADMAGVYRLSKAGRIPGMEEPLQSAFWNVAPRHYRHVTLIPTNICTPASEPSLDYRIFALVAGPAGATINAGFAARYDVNRVAQYCRELADDLRQGEVSDEELYVLFTGRIAGFQMAAQRPVTCAIVDGYGVCFTSESHRRWLHEFDIGR